MIYIIILFLFLIKGKDEEYKLKIEKVSKELEKAKKEEKELIHKESNILSKLQELNKKTKETKNRIKKLEKEEESILNSMNKLEIIGEKTFEYLLVQYNQINNLAKDMYNYALSNNIDLILSYYLEKILEDNIKRYNALKGKKRQIDEEKNEFQSKLERLVKIKLEKKNEYEKLEEEKKTKNKLLYEIRKEKDKKAQLIKELEARLNELEGLVQKTVKKYPRGEFTGIIWPVNGKVIGKFGTVIDPNLGTKLVNKGIDIETEEDANVHAVASGEVIYEGSFLGYGKIILIDHKNGFCTLYGYLSHTYVSKNEEINQGEVIGKVGIPPLFEQPTLHFEIRENGLAVDPLDYLK